MKSVTRSKPGREASEPQAMAAVATEGDPVAEAILLLRQGRADLARATLVLALIRQPHHAEALHLLGILAQQAGDGLSAACAMRRAVILDSSKDSYFCNLGVALRSASDRGAALTALRRAILLNPASHDAATNLGVTLRECAQGAAAERWLGAALRLKPDHPQAHYNLSLALADRGEDGAQTLALRKAIILAPDWPAPWADLALQHKTGGRLAAALRLFTANLRMLPGRAEVWSNLGNVLAAQGALAEAVRARKTAISLAPEFHDAYRNLGTMLWNWGETAGALLSLARAETLFFHAGTAGMAQKLGRQIGLIYAMIDGWCRGSLPRIAALLDQCDLFDVPPGDGLAKDAKFANGYYLYLSALLAYAQEHRSLYDGASPAILHVIGDSHGLAAARVACQWVGGRRTGQTSLIVGAKMHHIGRLEGGEAQTCLADRIARLPPRADLLLCFGEIDCRWDEGLWPLMRRSGKPAERLIAETVTNYLARLQTMMRGRDVASVTIQGVPYPLQVRKSVGPCPEWQDFLAMVVAVNDALRSGALARGWCFFDIFSATATGDGAWHLDDIHVKPGLYQEADRWMIVPGQDL